jgi:hypothetical protein
LLLKYFFDSIKWVSLVLSADGNTIIFWPFWSSCMHKCIPLLVSMKLSRLCSTALLWLPKKPLYPGGIRTRVFCFWDGCDVDCATPPRAKVKCWQCHWVNMFCNVYVQGVLLLTDT